ncbi:translation elongation factor Ts [Ignatzschineria sp. RMDPL8A]|uniref:translation elongation factor Ts n=1 Tax=Ignatzschineria sp. RMDPL8A TaxID=2999236 RepID=UPI0016AE21F4|nr:translation elongation factor Ts [Ignatzschineria sp. RMDPL8A]MDG9729001.1 translation elongation factor Ts [Ignatzschineria sp. RMDPL8A]NLD08450.1 elongation factor Ts [Xanthomonadaceae bacterium]
MANITAAMVKELRERTGSGMMECKKALTETNGDIDAAIDLMRKNGQASADKKAGRAAAEGVLLVRTAGSFGVIVEVNCETDFVTKNEDFIKFADDVANLALNEKITTADALNAAKLGDSTVDEVRRGLVAKIGENISVRRVAAIDGNGMIGAYVHGVRIAAIVDVSTDNEELAKDLAMHIAAASPICVDADAVPAELLERERAIYVAQAQESGRPENIQEKMIEGRMRKYLEEITLVGQAFVKDPDMTIEKLLKNNNATVSSFIRFGLGEGVEIEETDFAAEVMEQLK